MSAAAEEQGPATLLARHVVIPAAIIAMVAAFLFYLLEVRAVFLGGSRALKQVGLCFAAATVLIARYGRVHGNDDGLPVGQEGYTAALAVATLLFLLVSPAAGFLLNALILAAVWRFATGVTRALSLEGELDRPRRGVQLYGVERLRFEEFRRRQREEKGPAWLTLWTFGRKAARKDPDAHGNPVAAVARLAALALVGFAAGEPFILRAEPELGARALADVVVFLFAAAVVLAAGSAAGTLRHALAAGGRVSPGVLPARIALAALLAVAVLAAALAIPGVEFRGHGRLREGDRPGKTGTGESQAGKRRSETAPVPGAEEADPQGLPKGRGPQPRPQATGSEASGPTGVPLVDLLGGLGRLLRIPIVLAVLVLALLALRSLGAALPRCKDLLARLGAWLRRHRPAGKPRAAPARDPFAGLGALAALPPRDAVLAAYGRLLLALDQAGHPRPERTAPYEHLDALPRRLSPLAAPARSLTDLYVEVAYGSGRATEGDRQAAISALREVRNAPARAGEDFDGGGPAPPTR